MPRRHRRTHHPVLTIWSAWSPSSPARPAESGDPPHMPSPLAARGYSSTARTGVVPSRSSPRSARRAATPRWCSASLATHSLFDPWTPRRRTRRRTRRHSRQQRQPVPYRRAHPGHAGRGHRRCVRRQRPHPVPVGRRTRASDGRPRPRSDRQRAQHRRWLGIAGLGLYGATKAALRLLTRSWAAEFGPSGVRVNAVSPGPTSTPGTAATMAFIEQIAAQAPAGRVAAPDEIAAAISYLAGPGASFVLGTVLAVDGGRTAA